MKVFLTVTIMILSLQINSAWADLQSLQDDATVSQIIEHEESSVQAYDRDKAPLNSDNMHCIDGRIYVDPNQVELTEKGIVAYDFEGDIIAVGLTLSYDEGGLYLQTIFPQRGPCGIHHLWCKYCKGCGVIYCPMKCECPTGVGG